MSAIEGYNVAWKVILVVYGVVLLFLGVHFFCFFHNW